VNEAMLPRVGCGIRHGQRDFPGLEPRDFNAKRAHHLLPAKAFLSADLEERVHRVKQGHWLLRDRKIHCGSLGVLAIERSYEPSHQPRGFA
jgi:hypothetical protein